MARIRSKGNARTELKLIHLMRTAGVKGWRRNVAIFGRPDFVFYPQKVAVFVDGCFWHGCPNQSHSRLPTTRTDWWQAKILRNRKRDKLVVEVLRKKGWTVLRFWQCELGNDTASTVIARVQQALRLALKM